MHYLKIGYYMICSSPLLSLLLVGIYFVSLMTYVIGSFGTSGLNWLIPTIWMTITHTFVVVFQVLGILLYLVGYKKEGTKLKRSLFNRLIIASLIIWGMFVSVFIGVFYYDEVILWSMEPGVRGLVIWDHLEFVTWILKGLLWIVASFVLLTTSVKIKAVS